MKKNKFLVGIVAALAVSAIGLTTVGCNNVVEDIKKGWEQLTCEHVFDDGEVLKESTCVEAGEIQKTCTLCGKVEIQELELAEHIAVYVQAVTPTCIEKGKTDGTKCNVCDAWICEPQEIPALGHIVVKDLAVEPTCLEQGLTEGEHCSGCGEVLVEQKKVAPTGHSLEYLEAVEPTCTAEGKTQGVCCDKCEEVFVAQEIVPMLEHSFIDNGNGYFCEYCGISTMGAAKEVDVVDGELVAGNWYRIYRPTTANTTYYYQLSNAPTVGESWEFSQNLLLAVNAVGDTRMGYVFGPGPMGYTLEGMKCVIADDYVDIYFEVGVYNIEGHSGNNTCEITEESTISLSSSYGDFSSYIKRLVLGHEVE